MQLESSNSNIICERYVENNFVAFSVILQKIWTPVTYASDLPDACDLHVRPGETGALHIRIIWHVSLTF